MPQRPFSDLRRGPLTELGRSVLHISMTCSVFLGHSRIMQSIWEEYSLPLGAWHEITPKEAGSFQATSEIYIGRLVTRGGVQIDHKDLESALQLRQRGSQRMLEESEVCWASWAVGEPSYGIARPKLAERPDEINQRPVKDHVTFKWKVTKPGHISRHAEAPNEVLEATLYQQQGGKVSIIASGSRTLTPLVFWDDQSCGNRAGHTGDLLSGRWRSCEWSMDSLRWTQRTRSSASLLASKAKVRRLIPDYSQVTVRTLLRCHFVPFTVSPQKQLTCVRERRDMHVRFSNMVLTPILRLLLRNKKTDAS